MHSLKTTRLRLAPPRPRDWRALPVLRDPLALDPAEAARAARVFADWAELTPRQGPQDGGGWTVSRRLTRRPVGLILYTPDAERPDVAALSIAFNAGARGRGFAGEALGAALAALGASGPFSRFTAVIAPHNVACLRLFARAGFAGEGEAVLQTPRGPAEALRLARAACLSPPAASPAAAGRSDAPAPGPRPDASGRQGDAEPCGAWPA